MLDLKIKASRGLLEIEAIDPSGKRVGTIYIKPEECASAAWRRLGLGRMPAPSKMSEMDWEDILQSLAAEISELVNDPESQFYIYG